jgi:hypothetical protein
MQRRLIIILSLIVYSLSLLGQNPDDIIAKYINVMGGKEKLLSIKNVYMEGSMDMNGSPISVKYWVVNKKAMRYDYTINGMTSFNILTNDSGWIFNPMMGQTHAEPITGSMVRSSQAQLDPEGLLINYKSLGYKVDYKGKDEVDGTQSYKVTEKITDSIVNTYYFDTATYYILRISTRASVDGKVIDLSRDFSDYKKTPEGYTFPMSMGTGMGFGDLKFTVVKVNTNIDPALFKPKK